MNKKLIWWKRSSRTSIVNKIVTGRGKQNTFLRDSSVWKYFCTPKLSQEEKPLSKKKVSVMMNDRAIVETKHVTGEFFNLFLVSKRDRENLPVIDLKYLN